MEFTDNLDVCVAKMRLIISARVSVVMCFTELLIWFRAARDESKTVSIGYHGNIVDLW